MMEHTRSREPDFRAMESTEMNEAFDPITIFVTKIPKQITEVALRQLLEEHGKVVSFYVPTKEPTDNLTYVLCKYEHPWQAQAAIHALNFKQPLQLHVTLAKKNPKKKRSPNNNRSFQNNQNKKNFNNENKPSDDIPDNKRSSPNKFFKTNHKMMNDKKKEDTYNFPSMHDVSENKHSSNNTTFDGNNYETKSSEQFLSVTKNYFEQINNITEASDFGKWWNLKKLADEPIIFKISQKCPSCSQFPGGKIKFGYYFESKSCDKSLETSPAKNNTLKIVYDDFEDGYEFVITTLEQLPDKTWICLLTSVKFKDHYNSLFDDFAKECNKNLGGSNVVNNNTDMKAVCVLENRIKVWYRAIEFAAGKYAFIDRGIIVNKCELTHEIKCPEKFSNIPKFCSILRILSDSSEFIKVNEGMIWKISYKNEKTCIVANKNIIGLLEDWNPTDNTDKSQTFHNNELQMSNNKVPMVEESPKSFHKITSSPKSAFVSEINTMNSSQNFERNSLIPQSGQVIIIVNYVNSKELYVRLHGTAHDKAYTSLLNGVAIASDYGNSLTDPPEINTLVLCKYEMGYYRAKVLSFKDGYYNVNFIDMGKFAAVKLTDMKECKGFLAESPILLARVSLQGWERIHPNEPSPKIQDFMNDVIKNETPILMTFEDLKNGVQLKTQLSKTEINQKLTDITMSVIDKLKIQNKKPYELKVIMIDDMEMVDLDDLIHAPKPVKLLVLDTTQLINTKYIACTKFDKDLLVRFELLTKQINEYCTNQPEHYLPRQDEMCLALYEKDNTWYRAVVLNQSGSNVQLQFVDYGNMAIVDMTKIKKIVSDFTTLPLVASMCKISGLPDDPFTLQQAIKYILIESESIIEVSKIIFDEGTYTLEIPNLINHLKSSSFM